MDRYLNINAFAESAPDIFGTLKHFLPNLRGTASSNEYFGLIKRTPITDRINLEMRLEAFNAFNRVIFGGRSFQLPAPVVIAEASETPPDSQMFADSSHSANGQAP